MMFNKSFFIKGNKTSKIKEYNNLSMREKLFDYHKRNSKCNINVALYWNESISSTEQKEDHDFSQEASNIYMQAYIHVW